MAALNAVDKGLQGQNVLQSVVIRDSATCLLKINSPEVINEC